MQTPKMTVEVVEPMRLAAPSALYRSSHPPNQAVHVLEAGREVSGFLPVFYFECHTNTFVNDFFLGLSTALESTGKEGRLPNTLSPYVPKRLICLLS
jgi:hypothetical protein